MKDDALKRDQVVSTSVEPEIDDGTSTGRSGDTLASGADWPRALDVQYFEAELRLAVEFLEIAAVAREYAAECLLRALRVYVVLSGWVQSNGGNQEFEGS